MGVVETIEARWVAAKLPAAEIEQRRAELRQYVQEQIDQIFKNGTPKCLR